MFLGLFWFMIRNVKNNPKTTIIITMAGLIFLITILTIVKTYTDYQQFINNPAASSVLLTNLSLALFLDFSILMIGGLFLYLTNQLYTSHLIRDDQDSEP